MAPSILGLGIPHDNPMVPADKVESLKKILEGMEQDMESSPYDWEMFYVNPDMQFDLIEKKLREREWDCVLVGMGLRNGSYFTAFFEKIVNAVHKECPKAKFAFNASIEQTREACERALES